MSRPCFWELSDTLGEVSSHPEVGDCHQSYCPVLVLSGVESLKACQMQELLLPRLYKVSTQFSLDLFSSTGPSWWFVLDWTVIPLDFFRQGSYLALRPQFHWIIGFEFIGIQLQPVQFSTSLRSLSLYRTPFSSSVWWFQQCFSWTSPPCRTWYYKLLCNGIMGKLVASVRITEEVRQFREMFTGGHKREYVAFTVCVNSPSFWE